MKVVTEKQYEEHDCPGCGAKLKIEKEQPTHVITSTNQAPLTAKDIDDMFERKFKEREPKVEEKPKKEKKEVVLPPWVPRETCPNGNCTSDHRNEKYSQRVTKKCANGACGQFAPAAAARCPWCNSKDLELDERWEDLDDDTLELIPQPTPSLYGHTHEGE